MTNHNTKKPTDGKNVEERDFLRYSFSSGQPSIHGMTNFRVKSQEGQSFTFHQSTGVGTEPKGPGGGRAVLSTPGLYEEDLGNGLLFRESPITYCLPAKQINCKRGDIVLNADNGDIVLVEPGIYFENISFLDKNISLVALPYSGYEDNTSGSVVLDGEGQGSVVTINNGQDQSSILLGFEIQNGYNPDYGGGILIENSSPTIDRNVIHNNTAGNCGGSGGGIAVLGSSYPHIFGNEIFDNTVQGDCDCICYFGGGIYVDSLAWPILGGSTTIGNVFYDNYADKGEELYKNFSTDSYVWDQIYDHHNYFE